ncbi:MAG: 50S ribosomal protein L25 [Candidatus Omnitrophica bacterium]|jgi:large subunit ribosomal protein L25|nr:50S ribosomal protein L25 [Candidatus Omnitrophota bacterium]
MERVKLNAQIRKETGKGKNKVLRANGEVPVVSYKGGKEATVLQVNAKDLAQALHTKAGLNVLIDLNIKGKKEPMTVVVQEIQRDPLKDDILHVDFHEISLQDTVTMNIPVSLHGQAKKVIAKNAMVEHVLWEIEIECLATNIPEKFVVEISELEIGDSIHVKDLKPIEGVKILNDPEAVIVTTKSIKEEEEPSEGEEGETGEPEVIAKGKIEEKAEEEKE